MTIFLSIISFLALAAILLYWRLKATNGRLYWFTGNGFTSFSVASEPEPRSVTVAELQAAICGLLEKKGYDHLFIFGEPDPNAEGATLSIQEGVLSVSTNLRALKEKGIEARIIESMAAFGWDQTEHNPWNVGMGPDMESLTLGFAVPYTLQDATLAADSILRIRGYDSSMRFISAWDSAGFPRDNGLRVQVSNDPLEAILGKRSELN